MSKKLTDYSVEELQAAIQEKKNQIHPPGFSPYIGDIDRAWGRNPRRDWLITTEGDVEGRSTTTIGNFNGHLVDLAAQLHDQCTGAKLTFEPFPLLLTAIGKTIVIPINVPGNIPKQFRVGAMDTWLKRSKSNYPFKVEDSNYYSSVILQIHPQLKKGR